MGEAKLRPKEARRLPCKSPSGDLMEPPHPLPEQTINQRFDYALACARMRTDANACVYDTDTDTETDTVTDTDTDTEQQRCKKREKKIKIY